MTFTTIDSCTRAIAALHAIVPRCKDGRGVLALVTAMVELRGLLRAQLAGNHREVRRCRANIVRHLWQVTDGRRQVQRRLIQSPEMVLGQLAGNVIELWQQDVTAKWTVATMTTVGVA